MNTARRLLLEGMPRGSEGLDWPVMPTPQARLLLGLLYQFEHAETMPRDWVEQQQFRQARLVVKHAAATSPFYRSLYPAALVRDLAPDNWPDLPVLTRSALQEAGDAIVSESPPRGHEKAGESSTSGSTGMPVKVYKNPVISLFWLANTVREKLWRDWDFSAKLASIRPELKVEPGQVTQSPNWGRWSMVAATGPAIGMNVRSAIAQQKQFLERERPEYLLSLPSNIRALVEAGTDLGNLKGIGSYGELLEEPVRDFITAGAGCPVFDTYSSVEVGYMSTQCAEGGSQHILSDSVMLEVLDADGRPCRPGQTGRVVVTVLHNLLAPLIRYEVGDYAVAGETCSCGRSFPVLDTVLGRERNMIRLPDGSTHWPSFSEEDWAPGVPLRQFQIIQTTPDHLDVNLVARERITEEQETRMRAALQERFQFPFDITFKYPDNIPRSAGGKFEDFICRVPADA
jgi:phenylacetate-CoA ligase